MTGLSRVLLPLILLALGACAAPQPNPVKPQDGGPRMAVYLVAHEKHSGIAVRRADLPAGLWPERRDFPQADYLEVGWGDRDYYYGRNQGFTDKLRAIFAPNNPSVIHVVGVRGTLAQNFPASEVIELKLSRDGFERLIRYIHDAYDRAGAPVATSLGPGLYGDGRFYPGWETFNLLRTCNVWTARGLRTAGLPIEDSITLGGLLSQAHEVGTVVQRARE
ncbi:MAG TPA: DUF2459 domain-containing protein [Burkholderiales bacterium]|jgi:uncharacterized protein (TIGR02117 family)